MSCKTWNGFKQNIKYSNYGQKYSKDIDAIFDKWRDD